MSIHFWDGSKSVPMKGKELLFNYREAAEQHMNITPNRSRVR